MGVEVPTTVILHVLSLHGDRTRPSQMEVNFICVPSMCHNKTLALSPVDPTRISVISSARVCFTQYYASSFLALSYSILECSIL